jgi:hypothetical protein
MPDSQQSWITIPAFTDTKEPEGRPHEPVLHDVLLKNLQKSLKIPLNFFILFLRREQGGGGANRQGPGQSLLHHALEGLRQGGPLS